jgi:hypothetical protein
VAGNDQRRAEIRGGSLQPCARGTGDPKSGAR